MRKHAYFGIAAAIVAVLALLPAGSAYADGSVLTTGSAGGTAVAAGDVLTAGLTSGTTANFTTQSGGSQGIHCSTSSFSATVQTNPAAPGTATESLDAQSFSNCTTNIPGTTSVRSITIDNLPYSTSVDSSGARVS